MLLTSGFRWKMKIEYLVSVGLKSAKASSTEGMRTWEFCILTSPAIGHGFGVVGASNATRIRALIEKDRDMSGVKHIYDEHLLAFTDECNPLGHV